MVRRDWTNITFIIGLHLASLLAFTFKPSVVDIALFFAFYLLTGFGITLGYHRMLTHRAFDGPTWFRRLFGFLGAAALQGGPIIWVGTHRRHHRFTDGERDPHSPLVNFWHSHVGWMLVKRDEDADRAYAKDLARDPFFRHLDNLHFFAWVATLLVCYAVGGWTGVLWGGVIRTVWVWNVTWAVNSFCHVFGSRTYETSDESRNLWWVGVVALGEGWHNNHHNYQKSAFAGETAGQVDVTGYIVRALEAVGIARDAKRPKVWRQAAAGGQLAPSHPLLGQLRSEETAAAVLSAASLAKLQGSAAVTDLIQALEDESAAMRARVITALGKIGDARAVEPLIPHLYDNVVDVCREAAIALGHLAPTSESIEALREVLAQRRDEVAEAAAAALRRLEGLPVQG